MVNTTSHYKLLRANVPFGDSSMDNLDTILTMAVNMMYYKNRPIHILLLEEMCLYHYQLAVGNHCVTLYFQQGMYT